MKKLIKVPVFLLTLLLSLTTMAQNTIFFNPVAKITDTRSLALDGAISITTVEIDGSTYALVASFNDGVQIIDITDPSSPVATANLTDSSNLALSGANDITTVVIGERTYALVVAINDDVVQIIDITDPSSPVATASITDSSSLTLNGARSIISLVIGGHTYALVTAFYDDGVQIIDITDPTTPTATASITDSSGRELDGAFGITTVVIGGRTYALVAAFDDDGVQIIDITDPSNPTPTARVTDSSSFALEGAIGITTVVMGTSTYAMVAAQSDDAVQIIDITDPTNPTATASITDSSSLALDGARSISTVLIGERIYALVSAFTDHGVQIMEFGSDIQPPVFTLEGGSSMRLEAGHSFDPLQGVSAHDVVDGDVSEHIVVSGDSVDTTNVGGTYTIIYTVSDAVGNEATATVTVTITADVTPPVITPLGEVSYFSAFGELLEGSFSTDRPEAHTGSKKVSADLTGFSQPSGVDCSGQKTYAEALALVAAVGARLPTLQELQSNVTQGTGCSYDLEHIWTQTLGNHDGERMVDTGSFAYTDPQSIPETSMAYVRYVYDNEPIIPVAVEVRVDLGDPYIDAGATAIDLLDGDLTDRIVTVNPVDTSTEGVYTVTYNVSDANAAQEVTRTVVVSKVLSTQWQEAFGQNIALYPNPATDVLHLDYDTAKEIEYGIYNLAGQRVQTVKSKGTQHNLNVSELAPGMYVLEAMGESQKTHFRFVKN